jgi:CxxC motif-containing protein
MKEQIKILCITCPKGCSLEVTRDGNTIVEVKSGCKRGHEYAERELTDPRRMVASTVRVKHGSHSLLPVYTAAPFPKGKIPLLMQTLREVEVTPPITMGMVVVANVLDSGIDILASRDMQVKG